ncbi:MerR family transcriptional regulator [Clostridium tetani]|uniref:MerR family transcriptional regulator n=1 Tax=Clostridium tetani TaxID=1513 RepID=UPI0038B2CD15
MIKEAKLLTGLSANTIRFYESEGLICVKRNSNTYRKYDGKNIDELRRIKILRKLDVPISKIKELNNGKTSLHDIFQVSLSKQILSTLILNEPLLWLFNNINNRNYEFIDIEGILSIISTILLTYKL